MSTTLSTLLQSLEPRTTEELSLVRGLLTTAVSIQQRLYGDLQMAAQESSVSSMDWETTELRRLVLSLSERDRRNFDGLVEALEVYQSIHGSWTSQRVSPGLLRELKRIRDLCLEGGLHAAH